MKKIFREFYKIKIINIIYMIIFCLFFAFFFDVFKYIGEEILDIQQVKLNLDFITVYSGFLTLILPVAILVIERIENKDNAIISEVYLKETGLFPIIVYFVINLLIIAFNKNQYFFIASSTFSMVLVIYMYYKSFKMISNLIYEKEKISSVNEEIVSKDLSEQTMHFSDDNKITIYQKYGIYVGRYNYIYTSGYEMKNIYPNNNYLLIKQYNYKVIKKLIKMLKKYNREYIETFSLNDNKKKLNIDSKLNIIIVLSDIGSTSNKNRSWISIYYKDSYENDTNLIVDIINGKIYKTTEINNHLYIEQANTHIMKDCIDSINLNSSSLLSESLDKYLDLYKNYINEFSSKIGMISYEEAYNKVNSFIRFRGIDFLINIQKNIYDYSYMILEKNNVWMMNSLISFLYNMILYSYQKKELMSIQLLYGIYSYLCDYSLKFDDKSSFNKIKLEIFEFVNMLKYDLPKSKNNFEKDALLICNKTIGDIIFRIDDNNESNRMGYYKRIFNIINDIYDDINLISDKSSDSKYYNDLKEIYENFTSNIFAVTSYVLQKKKNINRKLILSFYKDINLNELTNILIKSFYFEYNNKIYSWDLMDIDDFDDDCVHNINTTHYFIHLYCLIIGERNPKSIRIESTYELSNLCDNIIQELKKLEKQEYISIFEKVKKDVEAGEKEYLRNTPISDEKVQCFINKFKKYYLNNNKILKLFSKTNNLKICKFKKREINYLAIRKLVNKMYFLKETPNNKYIIWNNFEDNYANSFIISEEEKYVSFLDEKSVIRSEKILNYLENLSLNKLKKSILFSDYETLYSVFAIDKISHIKELNKEFTDLFVNVKGVNIPVFIINGLENNCIYHVFENKLGKMEKAEEGFKIVVDDFYNNPELLEKYMNEKIKGLDLSGEKRENYLLESVNLFIQEYIRFNTQNLESLKFNK